MVLNKDPLGFAFDTCARLLTALLHLIAEYSLLIKQASNNAARVGQMRSGGTLCASLVKLIGNPPLTTISSVPALFLYLIFFNGSGVCPGSLVSFCIISSKVLNSVSLDPVLTNHFFCIL